MSTATLSDAPVETTKAIAEYQPLQAGLEALREKYQGVRFTDIQTTAGLKGAREALAIHVKLRGDLEEKRIELKSPGLAFHKIVDAQAKWINGEILVTEEPIREQIKAEEARKEAKKEADRKAEVERIAKLHERINQIRAVAFRVNTGSSLADVGAMMFEARELFDTDHFSELQELAESVKNATLQTLSKLREDIQARIAREEDLARQQAELVAMRAAQAKADAEAKAKAEEERKEAVRLAKLESDRLATERKAFEEQQRIAREAQAKANADRKVEQDKVQAERDAFDFMHNEQLRRYRENAEAEQQKLAAERAELDRQKAEHQAKIRVEAARVEADRKAQEAALAPAPLLIAGVVLTGVPTPIVWTLNDFRSQVAEYKAGYPEISIQLLEWAVEELERLEGLEL